MLLAWQNLWDDATLTTSSELAAFPGTNVQQAHLSRKWNTAAAVKAAYQVADLQGVDPNASKTFRVAALLGTNLTSAATIEVRASDIDPNAVANLVYDSGVINAGVKAGYGAAYLVLPADETARYVRIDVADASVPDNLQLGRIVLAPAWIADDKLLWNWGPTPADPSTVTKSRGGQSFPDILPQMRVLDFTLDYMSEDEAYDNPFAMARANGVVSDVLFIPFEAGTRISEQAVWGLCRQQQPLVHRATRIFRQKFTIEERL